MKRSESDGVVDSCGVRLDFFTKCYAMVALAALWPRFCSRRATRMKRCFLCRTVALGVGRLFRRGMSQRRHWRRSILGRGTTHHSPYSVDGILARCVPGPTGRFSLYGTPTDIKFKRVPMEAAGRVGDATNDYRVIDVSFSTLSQSTQTELPRRARMVATIPRGTQQAVMLVASSSASRWNKGVSLEAIQHVTESFRAIPAPTTTLRVRVK
jgi:hypothetical protein